MKDRPIEQNKSSFFKEIKQEHPKGSMVQTTTVTVNIDQKDDCFTGCIRALTDCFKR
jgi:hypothetical protein